MPRILGRETLDAMRCGNPECDCDGPLHLAARCHPQAKLDVSYHDGVLTVACKSCDKLVTQIAVADDDEDE